MPTVYSHKECPFVYCDSPNGECEKQGRCHYAPIAKGCTKPNCNCVEQAELKNGGNPVKSYPCLAAQSDDLGAFKSFFDPSPTEYANYLTRLIIRNGFTQLSDLAAYYERQKEDAKAFFERLESNELVKSILSKAKP